MRFFSNLVFIIAMLAITSTTTNSTQLGSFTKTFNYQGFTNSIEMYVPLDYDSTKSYPMLFAWHGYGMEASLMRDLLINVISSTGIDAIISCPNWNNLSDMEELSITMSMGYYIPVRSYNVDTFKIVVSGFSDGGSLAYQMGVQYPEMFKGIIGLSPVIRTSQYPEAFFKNVKNIKMATIVGDKDEFFPTIDSSMKDFIARGADMKYMIKSNVTHGDNVYLNSQEFFDDYKACFDFVMGSLGVDEQAVETKDNVAIYPNPVINKAFIELKGINEECSIELFDITGVSVLQKKISDGASLDLSRLTKGIYLARIEGGNKVIIKRISKIQ